MKELQAERERKAQKTREKKKNAIEDAKRKRIEKIADRRQKGVEKSIKRAQSVAPRNLEKIDKEMGDGTAMSKMLGNVGKLAVGTTRSAANLGKAAVKKAYALPAQARVARLKRKDEVESGIIRKLGSRLGRDDEYSRQKRIDKIGKLRSKAAARRDAKSKLRQQGSKETQGPRERGLNRPALPAAKERLALPSSTSGSALTAPTKPMTQRQTNDARIAAFKKKREQQGFDVPNAVSIFPSIMLWFIIFENRTRLKANFSYPPKIIINRDHHSNNHNQNGKVKLRFHCHAK